MENGAGGVRYQLAKQQIDQLFLKWLAHPATDKLITQLISEVNRPGPALAAPPSPIFISKIQTHQMSPKGQTPPRSPHGDKFMGRTLSPKQTSMLLEQKPAGLLSTEDIPAQSFGSPKSKTGLGYMEKFSKTDTEAMAKLVK